MSFDGLRLSSWKSPCLVKWNSGTKFPNYERLNYLNKTLYQQHYITSTSRYINQAMSARHDFNITLHYIALHCITLHYITIHYIIYSTIYKLNIVKLTIHYFDKTLHQQHITSTIHYVNNMLGCCGCCSYFKRSGSDGAKCCKFQDVVRLAGQLGGGLFGGCGCGHRVLRKSPQCWAGLKVFAA